VIDNFEVAWTTWLRTLAAGAEPAAENTPFQCGSISKPVFALAVMKLAESGPSISMLTVKTTYIVVACLPRTDGNRNVSLRHLLSPTPPAPPYTDFRVTGFGAMATVSQILQGVPPANNQRSLSMFFRVRNSATRVAGRRLPSKSSSTVTRRPFPELMRKLIWIQLE